MKASQAAACDSCFGDQSVKPTFDALLLGLMIGSPWASTSVRFALILMAFAALASKLNELLSVLGASKSGLLPHLRSAMIWSARIQTLYIQSSIVSSILWPERFGSGRLVFTVFFASAIATSLVMPKTVLMALLQTIECFLQQLVNGKDALIRVHGAADEFAGCRRSVVRSLISSSVSSARLSSMRTFAQLFPLSARINAVVGNAAGEFGSGARIKRGIVQKLVVFQRVHRGCSWLSPDRRLPRRLA